MRTPAILSLAALLLAACGDNLAPPPDAPSQLIVAASGASAQLSWRDNSDSETEFVVMRLEQGVDEELAVIGSAPADSTSFVDEDLTSGADYVYLVAAANDAGESDSPPVNFTAP